MVGRIFFNHTHSYCIEFANRKKLVLPKVISVNNYDL